MRSVDTINTPVNPYDFSHIITRLNNGDTAAFDELYKRCSGYIAFVCEKFCDSKEDAEEVVQDTFMIAYNKASSLRGETLIAYLRKVAIHRCYRKRTSNQSKAAVEQNQEVEIPPLLEEYISDKEQREELLKVVMSLPKMQWETVYLYYYAAFDTHEIAQLQGCSTSNVRKTLRNARAAIKEHLNGKRKSKTPKGLLLVTVAAAPLVAVFLAEEQVFAAVYVPTTAPCWGASVTSTAAACAATASVATPAVTYIAAACALVAVALSAVVYYSIAFDVIAEPAVALYAAAPPTQPPLVQPSYTPPATTQPTTEPEATHPAPTEPAPTEPPEATAAPTAPPQETLVPTEPPLPVVDTPTPTEPPPPPNRTNEIMAALATAHTAEAVAHIIEYYGFRFDRIMRDSGEDFHFYITCEGSGDIFVGIATCKDGEFQRVQFAHFYNGTAPYDVVQLIAFME